MPTEIINLEDDIIRDEEFIAIMDDDSFRSLSEIVNEITETLSFNSINKRGLYMSKENINT